MIFKNNISCIHDIILQKYKNWELHILYNKNINKNYKKSTVFVPNEKDKLFWCFYIIKYGIIAYEMVENKNIVFEKKIKIEYVKKIRQNKKIIKQYNIIN